MCIGNDYDYTKEEVDSIDKRFDRVIGSVAKGEALIKTRVGNKVFGLFSRKENGVWKTQGRYITDLPVAKN